MSMPHAPMPPQPEIVNVGPFDDAVMGPAYDNHGPLGIDILDDPNFDPKPKNKNKNKTPIEVKFEGYTLEKAPPRPGENWSWARVGRRPLPFPSEKIHQQGKRHRQRAGSPNRMFNLLTANQQGVINRIVDERKQKEKEKNADWELYDVQREEQWKWSSREVTKIKVILKRFDKTLPKNGKAAARISNKNAYLDTEIIDLAVSPKKTKDGKKPKKSKSMDDLDLLDDIDLGPPPPDNHGQHNPHGNNHGHPNEFHGPMPLPPPGAIPINQFQHNQPHQFPIHARPNFQEHPFQPHPGVPMPIDDGHHWPHPHHQNDRLRARSQSRERRPSARRPSMDQRRISQLEDQLDEINHRMNHLGVRDDSSDSYRENDDVFSLPASDNRSFTPPSSPRSYYSDPRPRGSLERRKSTSSRNSRYRQRYRSRDVDVEPEYTYRDDRPRYNSSSRRQSGRPSITRAETYNDYPDQRYLPAPSPPRGMQRRLTEGYGDSYDYRDQDRDDWRRRGDDYRRRSSRIFDDEPYQEQRRRGGGRRQSAAYYS